MKAATSMSGGLVLGILVGLAVRLVRSLSRVVAGGCDLKSMLLGGRGQVGSGRCPRLLGFPASLLPIAFTGQSGLDAALLARLQVKGVSFDFPDDVFIQHFPLE